MELPNKPTTPSQSPAGEITMIYGAPGVGKTHLAASITPAPLFFDYDDGARQQSVLRVDCTKQGAPGDAYPGAVPWQNFLDGTAEIQRRLITEKRRPYDYCVIDTFTKAVESASVYIQKQAGARSMVDGALAYGQGYKRLYAHLSGIFRQYRAMKVGLILLAHEVQQTYNDELGGEKFLWRPSLSPKIWDDLNREADHIVRLTTVSDMDAQGHVTRRRILSGEPNAAYVCKSRGSIYTANMDATWVAIQARYAAQAEAMKPKTATTPQK